jgi:hypothetical protein
MGQLLPCRVELSTSLVGLLSPGKKPQVHSGKETVPEPEFLPVPIVCRWRYIPGTSEIQATGIELTFSIAKVQI